jgi:putative membrane protein
MNKIIKVLLSAGLVYTMAGCGNATKDSTAKADSINHTNDSSEAKSPGVPATEVSDDDAKFAVAAANGGMAEVELGKLAQDKGSTMQVRDFGAMMVKDHSAVNDEMKGLAESKHLVLPDSLNNEEKELKANLMAKKGMDFDKAYVDAMVEDHEKDIKDFEHAAKIVKYPEMSAFIKKTLPILKMHLAEIQKIKAGMSK